MCCSEITMGYIKLSMIDVVFICEILLFFEVCLSAQQTPMLDIGVIAEGCHNQNGANQTFTSTTVWDESLLVQLHWTYIDSIDMYKLVRAVIEFQHRGMDAILLADDLPGIGGLPKEIIKEDIPILTLGGRVNTNPVIFVDRDNNCQSSFSPADMTTQSDKCLPPLFSQEHLSSTYINHSLSYLDSNILSVLHHLRWSELIILYDKSIEFHVDRVIRILSDEGRFVITYEIGSMDNEQINNLMETLDKSQDYEKINITLMGNANSVEKVLVTADQYVRNNKRRSSLSIRSLWMVFLLSDDMDMFRIQTYTESIDNVALLLLPTFFVATQNGTMDVQQLVRKALFNIGSNSTMTSMNKSMMNEMILDFIHAELQMCHWSPLLTLMFTVGGRGWSHVGYVDIMGNTAFHAEIFPNTRFGFNRRKFAVSTLELYPVDKIHLSTQLDNVKLYLQWTRVESCPLHTVVRDGPQYPVDHHYDSTVLSTGHSGPLNIVSVRHFGALADGVQRYFSQFSAASICMYLYGCFAGTILSGTSIG
ncbi:uncharacterized protein [Argopecten irradians]|uniref:uncharacterized protein n=1 Tax=Argopecten irradians TaxID=31199 RepID=UPI003718AFAC